MNSALYNSGYEIDGGYLEPQSSILNWKDESVNEYIDSLGRDNYRFPSFSAIDSTSINELKLLIDLAVNNGISITGLLPSFSKDYYSALINSKGHRDFFMNIKIKYVKYLEIRV